MITIQNIQDWAKPHAKGVGKQTRICNENIVVSIVGGERGLYGDFQDDFEIAILDKDSHDFVTKHFVPDLNDDVMPYASKEQLVELVNKLFKNDFQVL